MVEARRRDEWDRASLIVAAVVNSQFGRKTPVQASDFHPFRAKAERVQEEVIDVGISILRVFLPPGEREKLKPNGKRRRNQGG